LNLFVPSGWLTRLNEGCKNCATCCNWTVSFWM